MYKEIYLPEAFQKSLNEEQIWSLRYDSEGNLKISRMEKLTIEDLRSLDYRFIWDDSDYDITETRPEKLPFEPDDDELSSELNGFRAYEGETNEPKGKAGRPPKVDTGKLWALHNAGWDDKKIADELGVNIKTVRKYLEGGS